MSKDQWLKGVSNEDVIRVARFLSGHNIQLVLGMHMCVGAGDIPAIIDDVIGWLAKQHGLTKEEYIDFSTGDYNVQCSAVTKKGKRCKCSVGNHHMDAKRYLELQGRYCTIHEGDNV
jgi:hypothetical protein